VERRGRAALGRACWAAGGALLVMPLPVAAAAAGPAADAAAAGAGARTAAAQGRFELLALDVGQGTAVLVRTRHHLLVYDAGPLYSTESDAGQRVLVPLLRARGDERIDLLMLSHRDSDHVGGAASLLARVPVAALSTSLADDHPLRATALPHQPLSRRPALAVGRRRLRHAAPRRRRGLRPPGAPTR
jgi:competence protein ComEC